MSKTQKMIQQPVNVIFGFLQSRERMTIWLHENTAMRLEGRIVGFDEYMNLVLDDAEEVYSKRRRSVGRIMLKGDNIALIHPVTES